MKKTMAMLTILLLAGCTSLPTTGVIQHGGDVMTVAHQAPTGFHPTAPLKASAMKEASDYCVGVNKKFLLVNIKEIPGRAGQFSEVEVTFKCE